MTDLLVDIGNTRLKWRLQQQGAVHRSGAILVRDLNMAQLQAILPEAAGAMYWASVGDDAQGLCVAAWAHEKIYRAIRSPPKTAGKTSPMAISKLSS